MGNMAVMPETDGGEEQTTELLDRHDDGATLDRDEFSGSATFTVRLTQSKIDQLPENTDADEFAGNLVQSRIVNHYDKAGLSVDVMASHVDPWEAGTVDKDEEEYEVWARWD